MTRQPLTSLYLPDSKETIMDNQYRNLNKDIDSLIDDCVDADAIAYCIQRMSQYAGLLVEMERSDFPIPRSGQVWLIDDVGVVFIKSGFRNAIKAMSEADKELVETESEDKLRLWLHARNGTLLADALIDLVYLAYPELMAEEVETGTEDTQIDIPDTVELAE